jgi:CRISPR-associated protein Cas1
VQILNVLYLTDYRARIGVSRKTLVVHKPGSTVKIPIESLEAVVLIGGQITSEALDLCVGHGVRVSALRRSGRLRFSVGGPTSGNVHLRVAQVRTALDLESTAWIARPIVAAKLVSYRHLLQRWAQDADGPHRHVLEMQAEAVLDRIQSLGGVVDGDRLRGLEGDGTRRYFKGLSIVLEPTGDVGRFEVRSRRPPRDPVNALLSFLYGVNLAEVVGALEAVGLDPQIGFLHRMRPGRPSLGLDLLEELRPLADRLAVRLLRRRQVRLEHFTTTGAGAWYLSDEGRRLVIEAHDVDRSRSMAHPVLDRSIERWMLPLVQATLLARHLRGDLPSYPPYATTQP